MTSHFPGSGLRRFSALGLRAHSSIGRLLAFRSPRLVTRPRSRTLRAPPAGAPASARRIHLPMHPVGHHLHERWAPSDKRLPQPNSQNLPIILVLFPGAASEQEIDLLTVGGQDPEVKIGSLSGVVASLRESGFTTADEFPLHQFSTLSPAGVVSDTMWIMRLPPC